MYIKKIIIIYECCPHLITQNKQTKMRIMRMLALLNVAKSEEYQQEYKLSPTRFGPPDVNNFNYVKEKKMMG